MTAVPTAVWFAGLYEWSAAPKFLKSKMLQEAEQLTLSIHEREAHHLAKAAADTARISESNRLRDGSSNSKSTRGTAIRVAPLVESGRRTHEEEVLVTASPHCSEFGYRSSAAAEEPETDAATPTARSQQQQPQQQITPWTASSPSSIPAEWGQTRNAPVETVSVPSLSAAREGGSVVAAVSLARSASQPQQKDGCGSEAAPRPTAPSPLRTSLLHRPNCGSTAYSLTTLSETIDDRLNEALLRLEDDGNEVGEALVERREKEALLLIATEEDLSGTRISSSEELMASASQRAGLDYSAEDRADVLGNTPASKRWSLKRGREEAARGGRTSRSGNRRIFREGGDGRRLSRGGCAKSACGAELLQSTRDPAKDAPPPQHLTRADIRRTHSNQPPEEDSQVVFFDH
ncbi:conserved hypothetical protein [Leishmania mexicana MHOM/GT/2001/U1103]|uniref:Uncharacterized protein n=1 Tax=Leishmania mexicana (strain MHOM/GT/2001/U1103) TaxID=929439 RepID=E9B5A7_LEIMU|nr:conserved hypothetical protein [Leishmania mexicana MHOM/GT/2001/U1103]CBZ30427.1 conserved hypothetical protein [Leishmania mexicana MHOM/GT/2001/U1103]